MDIPYSTTKASTISSVFMNTGVFGWIDALALGVYFFLVLIFGIWVIIRLGPTFLKLFKNLSFQKASCKNRGSVGGYFLAGRSMNFLTVGTSLFASNIGSVTFVGLAGSGAATGIGVAIYDLSGVFFLILLGWIFAPLYVHTGIVTIPEYLRRRFGGQRIRVYLSCLSLLLYILCKISVDLFAGALFIKVSFGWDLYLSIIVLILIAALFATIGGLTAVMWTDFVQAFVMVIGSIVVAVIGFNKVNGYSNFKAMYPYAIATEDVFSNKTCSIPPTNSWSLVRDVNSDLPWPGVLFGLTIISIWYWCSDQVIVQRTLASKNMTHLKMGVIVCGYLKILPMFIMIMPGMISKMLYPDEIGCSDPDKCVKICESTSGCSNIAYALLVVRLLPIGLKGLMFASIMAALLSSLTSIFNSASTLFTIDIYKRIRKQAKDLELLLVGKLFVILLVGVSIAWIPIMKDANGSLIFIYLQSVTSYLTPPFGSIFLLAILWKRCNEPGAFWGLMVGLVFGLIRLMWEFAIGIPTCLETDNRPYFIRINYLYYATFLWAVCTLTTVVVSLTTKKHPNKEGYTYFELMRNSRNLSKNVPKGEVEKEKQQVKRRPDFCEMNLKQLCFWTCGLEMNENQNESQNENDEQLEFIDISQTPKENLFCNIQAVILICITSFLIAFFNRF